MPAAGSGLPSRRGSGPLSETLKTGWKPITPSQVTIVLDQYAPAGAMDPVVFKNLEPACKSKIEVQKVGYGTDADGKEVMLGPLAGWKVTVSRADGTMTPVTKVTDGLGKAIFAGLPPGVYKVKETVQVGWEVMGDNPQTVIHRDCETDHGAYREHGSPGQAEDLGPQAVQGLGSRPTRGPSSACPAG